MATIYNRICSFEEQNPTFQFHQKGSNVVGLLCAQKWKQQGGRVDQLDVIQSAERFGTFMVFDYPNSFTEDIDQVIKSYVKVVINKGKQRRNLIVEKPADRTKPQKQNRSGPSPTIKKRKRIPLAKPAFSGNQFKR